MKAIFLGTGTSNGVPQIGCNCDICTSLNPKNKRYRSSLFIKSEDTKIIIDTSPEFRLQCLRENISSLNAVILTHSHADHLFGLDDIRAFTEITAKPMPVYTDSYTSQIIKNTFSYIFQDPINKSPLPKINLVEIEHKKKININSIKIIPIEVKHGNLNIMSYKINDFLYCTDCNFIPQKSEEFFYNLDTLVIGALRYKSHHTHFNIEEAIKIVEKYKPKITYFTHMTHHVEYDNLSGILPENIKLAYDGLVLNL